MPHSTTTSFSVGNKILSFNLFASKSTFLQGLTSTPKFHSSQFIPSSPPSPAIKCVKQVEFELLVQGDKGGGVRGGGGGGGMAL